jgi:hypothetical protein
MLAEAIAAGEKLLETKARLPHGEFGAFKAYCEVSRSSASHYVRLAREKSSAGVLGADSIRGALRALGGEPKKEPIPKAWDWFFQVPGNARSVSRLAAHRPPRLPRLGRRPAGRAGPPRAAEDLRRVAGRKPGAQLRRRDLGDPSVEHDFGPLYSCDEALRGELRTDELRALRDLVDATLRERARRHRERRCRAARAVAEQGPARRVPRLLRAVDRVSHGRGNAPREDRRPHQIPRRPRSRRGWSRTATWSGRRDRARMPPASQAAPATLPRPGA